MQSILASAVDAIIIIGDDGTIESANPAAALLFQYEIDEFIGQNVKFLMPDPDRSQHDTYLKNYKATGRRKIIGIGREVSGQRRDGSVFPLHLSVGEFTADGDTFYTGIIRDLTEQSLAQKALLQSQKMDAVGQLTGGVAHDFNNLLMVIVGNLELFESSVESTEYDYLLHEAIDAAEKGASLIARLLAFARQSPLAPQVVDVNKLVSGLAGILSRAIDATIEMKTILTPDPWMVKVDPGQFENAIINLAVNARDAMQGGGTLIVETGNKYIDELFAAEEIGLVSGEFVQVSITDSGEGIAPDMVKRVFDPFFTTKEVGQGTGLGLSMVYGFTKQSGGHVTMYSEPGKGTTVNLYLPRHHEKAEGRKSLPTREEPVKGEGAKILVVEDDERILRLTRLRLESLGHTVVEANNGVVAYDQLDRHDDLDLVFSDLVMPGEINGYDVARQAQEVRPGIKVLLTSGYAEEQMNAGDLANSKLKLLRKPYSKAVLADAIQDVLKE